MKATLRPRPLQWVRLPLELLNLREFQTLPKETCFFFLECLMLCGQYDGGVLPDTVTIGWSLRYQDPETHVTLLGNIGLLTVTDTAVIVTDWERWNMAGIYEAESQSKSASYAAEKQRRYRERKANKQPVTEPPLIGNTEGNVVTPRARSRSASESGSLSAVSERGLGETVTDFTPQRSAAVTTIQRADPRRRVDTEHSLISMGEFRTAWDRHHRRHNRESMDMAYKQILSMGETFDPDRFRRNHPAYCDHWDKIGWEQDFGKALTFIAWLQNGMPEPPPAAKPVGKQTLVEMLAEIAAED